MKKSKKRKTSKPPRAKVQRVLVITEGSRVIGTQVFAPPRRSARSTAVLQAGPGQKMHELEIEVPPKLGAHEISAFHESIAGRLRLDK